MGPLLALVALVSQNLRSTHPAKLSQVSSRESHAGP